MKDQIEHLVKHKIVAETINSKMGVEDRNRVCNDLKAKCSNTQLLYITPEQAATSNFQVFPIQHLTALSKRTHTDAFVFISEYIRKHPQASKVVLLCCG